MRGAIAQTIIVGHGVLTYAWDKQHQWVGDAFVYLFIALSMTPSLSRTLSDRGYMGGWAALGVLGPIGIVVIHSLPDRTMYPARGFPIEPRRP